MTAFAIYAGREITVRYFGGMGYVVRHEMFPRTTFPGHPAAPVTRQGHAMLVGIRQGLTDGAGFAYRRYTRPDTAPRYVPPGYRD